MKRVRITTGNSTYDTKIVDAENGNELASAYRVEITLDVNNVPSAKIYTYMPVVDIEVDAEIKSICPICGKEQQEECTR